MRSRNSVMTKEIATKNLLRDRKVYSWLISVIMLALGGCSENGGSSQENKSDDLFKQAFPWLKDSGRTEDMTPVEIELVDERSGESLHFRIPKAYLTNKSNWVGGKHGRIKIETGLPELKPRPGNIWVRRDDPDYDRKIGFFRNGLFINLDGRRPDPQYEKNVIKRYKHDYKIQPSLVHDLNYYKYIICSDIERKQGKPVKAEMRCREHTDEYFITPPESSLPWVAMTCTKLEVNSGGGCIVSSRYRDRKLEYIFRTSQLHRWREFDTAARKLLDQFLIESPASLDVKS